MNSRRLVCVLAVAAVLVVSQVSCQRDNDDDFDDSGFDDSGYSNNQPSRDAEESNQNPSNYPANEEDSLDDDDDVDETRQQVSQQQPQQQQQQQQMRQQQQQYYGNVAPQPFYAPPNSVLLAGFDPTQPIYNAASTAHQARYRRAIDEKDIEDASKALKRNKRYAKKKSSYIGPVYTYVKTDKHAHYKWGVKHKVGKHYGR